MEPWVFNFIDVELDKSGESVRGALVASLDEHVREESGAGPFFPWIRVVGDGFVKPLDEVADLDVQALRVKECGDMHGPGVSAR